MKEKPWGNVPDDHDRGATHDMLSGGAFAPAKEDDAGANALDERPRLSCSGSGRITRAFHLRHLENIVLEA